MFAPSMKQLSLAAASAAALLLVSTACTELEQVEESLGSQDNSSAEQIETELVRVIDGDTLVVEAVEGLHETSSDGHSVRLLGLDAPEMDWDEAHHECGAQEATEHIEEILNQGQDLTLIFDDEAENFDRFDRALAYVETEDSLDIGASVIESGYAAAWYPDSEPTPQRYSDYAQLQDQAQDQQLGAWESCAEMGR